LIKAVYPGSFDPLTNGHLDIIERASGLFKSLVVAVVKNPGKTPLFTIEERVDMLRRTLEDRIMVKSFSGLLVDFLMKEKAKVIVKGLRALSDFEFEYQMALLNRQLCSDVDTIFLMTGKEYAFLSSSSVREIASLGGSVKGMVPPYVEERLSSRFGYNKTDLGQKVSLE
jgi:pantetheine-phosphate adenylyltransferase